MCSSRRAWLRLQCSATSGDVQFLPVSFGSGDIVLIVSSSSCRGRLFFSCTCDLGCTKALVRFFKNPHQVRDIIRTFFKSLRVPFAAWGREGVPAVYVDCGRDLLQWIGNRMYHGFTEGDNVLRVDRLGSQLDEAIFAPTIERIVFPSSIDAYDRPHQMVVRVQTHGRTPQNVEDRSACRTVKGLDSG